MATATRIAHVVHSGSRVKKRACKTTMTTTTKERKKDCLHHGQNRCEIKDRERGEGSHKERADDNEIALCDFGGCVPEDRHHSHGHKVPDNQKKGSPIKHLVEMHEEHAAKQRSAIKERSKSDGKGRKGSQTETIPPQRDRGGDRWKRSAIHRSTVCERRRERRRRW